MTNHFLSLASRVCATGLLMGLALLLLPWGGVFAQEDPRIREMMQLLSSGSEMQDPRITAKLEVLSDPRPAPEFTLNDFEGNAVTSSELRGKPLFVHFWSVYCPHCAREVSTLEQMFELYYALKEKGLAEETEFLAINFGESKDKIIEWAKAHGVSLEPDPEGDIAILLDTDKAVTKSWKVWGLPSTFLVNKEGQVVAQAIGERNWTTPAILNQIGLLPGLGELPK